MPTAYHIERHQLPCYLRVFNRFNDKPMGCLGNASLDGLMLISQLPMLVGGRFGIYLKVPGKDEQQYRIDLFATCLWCHEDVSPGYYDSGFSLATSTMEYTELIDALRFYFSFHPLAASA